jgi:hypothetical protein
METPQNYRTGKKQGMIRPCRGKQVAKNRYKEVYDYILDSIDSSGYDIETTTPKEKLNFLEQTFQAEYGWAIKRYGRFTAMTEWLPGLPSSVNIDYENHKIIELAKKWGHLPVNATEKQEDKILEGWFRFIAMRIGELMRKYEVQS